MYAGLGAVVTVQFVIISYIVAVLRDPDSFAKEEIPKAQIQANKPVIPKKQRGEISQETVEKMRELEEKERTKQVGAEATIEDPKLKATVNKDQNKGKETAKQTEKKKAGKEENISVTKSTVSETKPTEEPKVVTEIKKEPVQEEGKKKKNKNKEKKE